MLRHISSGILRPVARASATSRVAALAPRAARCYAAAAKFTETHEWVKISADGTAAVGITDYAQTALGDIVYVDLPEVGRTLAKGESFGAVESVKAASDVYAPVAGTVTAVNEKLRDDPALVNKSPESDGWFMKIKVANPKDVEALLDKAAYDKKTAA
eukprot:tig00000227_g19812.t1